MAQRGIKIKPHGDRLIRERTRRKLTQLQAAVAIGISPMTLARAESGKSIQLRTLDQIAAFYEVDRDKLGKAS